MVFFPKVFVLHVFFFILLKVIIILRKNHGSEK